MQEFDNLIKYCIRQFDAIPFCQQCLMSQCRRCDRDDCYECLHHIHSINTKNEHYACEKITYNYILKHGYRYASEMAWAFNRVKDYFDLSRSISILSVGCGPSTELYGAIRVFKTTPLYYRGFDLSYVWHSIQQFNCANLQNPTRIINYYDAEFINYVLENDLKGDILVFNYFFSDFVKYKPQKCETFIDELVKMIQDGRFSVVIINDIMLTYNEGTAYSCMEKIARSLKSNQKNVFSFERRHFKEPNQWQITYGNKHTDDIIFRPLLSEAMPFDPFTTCGSMQLLIKTTKLE